MSQRGTENEGESLSISGVYDAAPQVDVAPEEYARLLGFPPGRGLEGRSKELAAWAAEWYRLNGRPFTFARQVDKVIRREGGFEVEGKTFGSKRIVERLTHSGADSLVLTAVSAGPECETFAKRLWSEEKPDEYFFLEVYGSAVVEHLVLSVGYQLCAWADERGMAVLPHESPGYPGWRIEEQAELLSLIKTGVPNHAGPAGLRALESGMLYPKKSLLAVFPVSSHPEVIERVNDRVPCERCSLRNCQYRRLPYRRPMPQVESVRNLQSNLASVLGPPPIRRSVAYSIGQKALEKWANERLTLSIGPGGSVNASFRYDGTTCSNMGRPLAFQYDLVLEHSNGDFVIRKSRCSPVDGDTGHTFMCEYITDRENLMKAIAAEGPAPGGSLEEEMSHDAAFSPAGCFCDPFSRRHKWRIVLEVLHYALSSRSQI